MTPFRFLIYSIILVAVMPSTSGQFSQRAVLYDQRNGQGNFVEVTSYIPDLSTVGFKDKTESVRITGIWLFYHDIDYAVSNWPTEYIVGINVTANIIQLSGIISSMRYAGSREDFRENSFTIYEGEYFQGEQEFTQTSLPNLTLAGNHKSIIITGDTDWTVYDQPSYKGNGLCLLVPNPMSSDPAFIYDTERLNTPIPHGSIKSIEKGCRNV